MQMPAKGSQQEVSLGRQDLTLSTVYVVRRQVARGLHASSTVGCVLLLPAGHMLPRRAGALPRWLHRLTWTEWTSAHTASMRRLRSQVSFWGCLGSSSHANSRRKTAANSMSWQTQRGLWLLEECVSLCICADIPGASLCAGYGGKRPFNYFVFGAAVSEVELDVLTGAGV